MSVLGGAFMVDLPARSMRGTVEGLPGAPDGDAPRPVTVPDGERDPTNSCGTLMNFLE